MRVCDGAGIPAYGGYVAKITNDAREEEMEGNMAQVSTMVGNLRNMALDMGSEIQNQNTQLDRINMKVSACETLVNCFYSSRIVDSFNLNFLQILHFLIIAYLFSGRLQRREN